LASESPETVPRRLRRFYRKGQAPEESQAPYGKSVEELKEELKQNSSEMAEKEIRRFKQRFNRLPKESEGEEIAESIYEQAKKQAAIEGIEGEEHGRFRHARQAQEEKASKEARKPRTQEPSGFEVRGKPSETSIAELFKDEKLLSEESTGKKKQKEIGIEDFNINSEELKQSLDALPEGEDSESFFKEVESEKNSCPNCGTKTEHLVFCPECGAAFCTHCAKQAKAIEDKVSFVCPKCGKEFKARKIE